MMQALVSRLARTPKIFDFLRWLLEGGFAGHNKLVREELQNAPGNILDLGCGTGIFAPYFDPNRYVGVDISEEYVKAARRKFPSHCFECVDAERLGFAGSSFDACFVAGVFHHLDDKTSGQVLREIRRVLKPGGLFVVWEDIPSPVSWNFVGHFVHAHDEGKHIRKPEEYRRLFGAYFRTEKEYYMRSGFMDYIVFRFRR
jgi:ubiquinone/menaquinone biosynthesis C-methylase UbiE